MSGKTSLAICFGGKSPEHEVSVVSALNILRIIDYAKYDVTLFYLNKKGFLDDYKKAKDFLLKLINQKKTSIYGNDSDTLALLEKNISRDLFGRESKLKGIINNYSNRQKVLPFLNGNYDVIFPVFHGENGEDGTFQGMLEFLNIPYIGCGLQSSALCIDKDVAKRICKSENIKTADWIIAHRYEWDDEFLRTKLLKEIKEKFADRVYIKPSRLGSSIGVYPAIGETELLEKAAAAFEYDSKIIFEELFVKPREITIGVMGSPEEIILSEIGEFNYVAEDYFNYNAKYGINSREGIIPPEVNTDIKNDIIKTTRKLFKVFQLEGFARVDYFLCGNALYFNEINTIPGLDLSGTFMRMWGKSGFSYGDFIDKVVYFALKRHNNKGLNN